jgi:RimJ/RimL family protein N-acetyltransferase
VTVVLRPISRSAAQALRDGRLPDSVRVAADYPTEFSAGVGQHAADGGGLGPYFLHRTEDDVVVGEIGGGFVGAGTIEIGYAVVASCWGRGYATEAVREIVRLARGMVGIDRIVAHTPLDRPASGRVLEKAGFALAGEVDDQNEGKKIRVRRWELALTSAGARVKGGARAQP